MPAEEDEFLSDRLFYEKAKRAKICEFIYIYRSKRYHVDLFLKSFYNNKNSYRKDR